jgi:hypothetical protein
MWTSAPLVTTTAMSTPFATTPTEVLRARARRDTRAMGKIAAMSTNVCSTMADVTRSPLAETPSVVEVAPANRDIPEMGSPATTRTNANSGRATVTDRHQRAQTRLAPTFADVCRDMRKSTADVWTLTNVALTCMNVMTPPPVITQAEATNVGAIRGTKRLAMHVSKSTNVW